MLAVRLTVGCVGTETCEFTVDLASNDYFFVNNTRLQMRGDDLCLFSIRQV